MTMVSPLARLERCRYRLLELHVHWIVLLGASGERAEDDVAFPVGSALSQSNPGGFESMLGAFLSGFNAGRSLISFSVLYDVKRIFWQIIAQLSQTARQSTALIPTGCGVDAPHGLRGWRL